MKGQTHNVETQIRVLSTSESPGRLRQCVTRLCHPLLKPHSRRITQLMLYFVLSVLVYALWYYTCSVAPALQDRSQAGQGRGDLNTQRHR